MKFLVTGDNLAVVKMICAILDDALSRSPHRLHGHENANRTRRRPAGLEPRYAVDDAKIRRDLGWQPRETLATGLNTTVRWYLDHRAWWEAIRSGVYRGERLGELR